MPTYKVTDPNTGKTVRLTGDSPPTEAELNDIFSKVKAPAPSTMQNRKQKGLIGTFADTLPVAGGVLGGIGGGLLGGVAGSIVPGAGTAAGAIGGGAGGAAIGTGAGVAMQNMIQDLTGTQDEAPVEQVGSAVRQAVTAGVLDAATAGTFRLVGKGGGMILKALSKGADDIPLRSLRINPSQLTNFKTKHGIDMGDFVVKKKLFGENAIEEGAKQAGSLQSQFDNLALNENITIPVDKLKERFAKEIKTLAGLSDEGTKDKITPLLNKGIAKNILKEWESIAKQLDQMKVETVTPKQLTEFRRMIDDVIPDSQFVDPSVKNISVRIRKIMNDVIRDGVDSRLIGESTGLSLKELGQELSKYYDFLEAAEKQSNLGRGSLVPNITRLLSVGVGAGLGGIPGVAGGLATEAALRSPNVLSALYKTGKVGGKLAPLVEKAGKGATTLISPFVGAGGSQLTK